MPFFLFLLYQEVANVKAHHWYHTLLCENWAGLGHGDEFSFFEVDFDFRKV